MEAVRIFLSIYATILLEISMRSLLADAASYHPRIPRMIRGRDASMDQWKFIVHLKFYQTNPKWKICGGALFKRNWVITAAHCIEDIPNKPQFVAVIAGNTRASVENNSSRTYQVVRILGHQRYFEINSVVNKSSATHFNWDYDIALLKLAKSVESPFATIELPGKNFSISDFDMSRVHCKSAGWGSRKEYEREVDVRNQHYEPSSDLQEIDVPLVSKQACKEVHNEEVTDLVFCGGQLLNNAMTTCIGDSGSPLVCNINEKRKIVLAGIAIGGNDFCRTGKDYMMFTEVSKFREWIDKNSRE